MAIGSLEEGIQQYIGHIERLGFEFWDTSNAHDLIFVKHDNGGRQLYVSIAATKDSEMEPGQVQIMYNPRSEGVTLTEEDEFAETIFRFMLKQAGYAICFTDINGRNKGNVVEKKSHDEFPITRITYQHPNNILRIGKDPMDVLKNEISEIADAFAGLNEYVKLNYQGIASTIAKLSRQ